MLTLNDGRAELWQWDTGRTLAVDADCSQVHFSNKVFGRSIDVDVVDGVAIIPDILLQTDKDLNVWAFVGTAENGYTKISKIFKVNRRNKPADYVFTPPEQTTIAEIAAIAQSVRDDADAGRFDGAQGPAGPVGPVGPKGDTGEQGPAGAGVPDGGTSGQLLSKTESGTSWIDPPQSGVQPDWNQNDSTAADYVKNRPFYTGDPVETVFVEESTVTFADQGGMYAAEFPSTFVATGGETYKVYWDSTAYECVCENFNNRIPIIGNKSIIGFGSDTGEPFIIFNESGPNETGWASMTKDASASHTISISGFSAPEVVKIDEKYIPTIPADKLPTIPADKLPTIPADKLPTIPVIEFTTRISDSIANNAQQSFTVSNLSYSEIYAIVEKGNFQIKDSDGVNYRPIKTKIRSSGSISIDILVFGTPMTYANLVCTADQTRFYRNAWWQIEATKK